MSNHKGFTLLETLIVLSISVIVFSIFNIAPSVQKIQIKQDLMLLYEFLLRAQNDAIKYHQQNDIVLNHHLMQSNYDEMNLETLSICYASFHYNEKGHISQAITIDFYNSNQQIVAQLGSGSLDIR